MIEPENVTPKNAADVLDATEAGAEWSDGPVRHVERRVDDGVIAFFCRLLQKMILDFFVVVIIVEPLSTGLIGGTTV